jgi:hypothetical protein
MNYLDVAYYIMTGVFISYTALIIILFGILPSISDSWYKLSKKLKPLFTLFCWGFSVPAIIIGVTISEGSNFQFLIFLAGSGIAFVGAAPDFKSKTGMDRKVHYAGALIGVIFSQLFIGLVFPQFWYVNLFFVTVSILMLLFKKRVEEILWIEIVAFLSICYVYGVKLSIFKGLPIHNIF